MVKVQQLKRWLIPLFCLFHMAAITWWTLPHSFGGLVLTEEKSNAFEARLFKGTQLDEYPAIMDFFERYIDVTGSQQYWDFFAPHSPRYHQYLSICQSVLADPEQGRISCTEKPLFTNLDDSVENSVAMFKAFGSDRSRLYRLTETLVKLEDTDLQVALTRFYQRRRLDKEEGVKTAHLVLHQFELHPELKDLPKAGYRMDKVLLARP